MSAAFDTWLDAVDQQVEATADVSVHDLADWDFYSAFEDGMSPAEAAKLILIENGWES